MPSPITPPLHCSRLLSRLFLALLATLSLWIPIRPALAEADWAYLHLDTFDNAANSNDYGLNDRLGERRLHLGAPVSWIRKSGSWYDKPVIREWWSQVNHPVSGTNALSFHSELSAVMLNSPIGAGVDGGYRISLKTDPSIGNTTASEWTSIMLDSSPSKRGWVTEMAFGLLIRSNGGISLYQNGSLQPLNIGGVPAATTYEVDLWIGQSQLNGTINGTPIHATLSPVPQTSYLYLGSYIDAGTGVASTFDDLAVRVAVRSQKKIRQHGYYWASSTAYGSHIPAVSTISNFNFVDGIDQVNSNNCPMKSCLVQIRWEFFDGPALRSDWQARWAETFQKITQRHQFIRALYHVDEPFLAEGGNVSAQDLQTVISRVASDLATIPGADIKQMATFSAPELNDPTLRAKVAALQGLDWVAFDAYVPPAQFESVIPPLIAKLKSAQPGKSIILVPQTAFLGVNNDADVARINWMFYNQALLDDSIIGLLYFGYWTHDTPTSTPANRPVAYQAQSRIWRAIRD